MNARSRGSSTSCPGRSLSSKRSWGTDTGETQAFCWVASARTRPVGRGGRVASASEQGDTTDDDYRPDQGGREPKRVATEGRKHTKIDSHAASDPADLQKSREAHYGSWYVNPPGRAEPGRHLVESRERRLARRDDPANEIHVRPLTIRPLAADTRVSSDPCGYSSSSTSLAQPTERIEKYQRAAGRIQDSLAVVRV